MKKILVKILTIIALSAFPLALSFAVTNSASTETDKIDQEYWPDTADGWTEVSVANEALGQTFKPAQSQITKVQVDLVGGNDNLSLKLTDSKNKTLTSENFAAKNGPNEVIFSSPVALTKDLEYRIFLESGSGAVSWVYGETGSEGKYTQGHAIVAGAQKSGRDFHFKTFYATAPASDQVQPEQVNSSSEQKPPTKPTGLRVSYVGYNYLVLSWNQVTDDNLAAYIIDWGNTPGKYNQNVNVGVGTSVRIGGLNTVSNKYYFIVKAQNFNGANSDPSDELAVNWLNFAKSNWWAGGLILVMILSIIMSIYTIRLENRRGRENQGITGNAGVDLWHQRRMQ